MMSTTLSCNPTRVLYNAPVAGTRTAGEPSTSSISRLHLRGRCGLYISSSLVGNSMMGVRGMKQLALLAMLPSCGLSWSKACAQFPSRLSSPMPQTEISRSNGRITWLRCQELNSRAHDAASSLTKQRLGKRKMRLDELCLEKFPQYSRTLIQSWILQGKVIVDGRPAAKAGTSVKATSIIDIIADIPKYVCRAGYKLEGALQQFAHDVKGKVVLDAGLSTGGFSDCLLQNGAARIYGVDVGYGQVAEKIRVDPRVTVIERTNLRFLPGLPEQVDLVTLDLSFISILLVMPTVCSVMRPESSIITLIKPQFEARRSQVGGGGIVRDPAVHKEVLRRVIGGVEKFGFKCQGWIQSPITGAEGNIEFLAYFHRLPLSTASTGTNLIDETLEQKERIDQDDTSEHDETHPT